MILPRDQRDPWRIADFKPGDESVMSQLPLKILVYKRTHEGDPGPDGCFGVYDCMGSVRDRDFDAVIGVGGIGGEAQSCGIAGTVNWIGIGPHKRQVDGKRGPEVTFGRFEYLGGDGPDLESIAPALASRMYDRNVRSILDGLTDRERAEAMKILALAGDAPPSPSLAVDHPDPDALRRCKRVEKPIQRRCGCEPTDG